LFSLEKCSFAGANSAFSHFERLAATAQNPKNSLRKDISVGTGIFVVALIQKMLMAKAASARGPIAIGLRKAKWNTYTFRLITKNQ